MLVKDYQLDPVTHQVLHADFYRIAMDRAIQVTIPVVVKGEPKGVKQQGGVLEFIRREIEIECLPGGHSRARRDRRQRADAASGRFGSARSPTDVKWKPLSEPDMMLVHVIMPKAEEAPAAPDAAAAPAAAAPAEPEVIKKGKKDERSRREEEVVR